MAGNEQRNKRLSLFIPVLVALVSLLGVMLGSGMQYLLSRKSETLKLRENLQAEAFLLYMEANTKLSYACGQKDKSEYNALMRYAIQRIAVYGNKPLVQAMINFQNSLKDCSSPDSSHPAVPLFQNMRNDLMPEEQRLEDSQMASLLRYCK